MTMAMPPTQNANSCSQGAQAKDSRQQRQQQRAFSALQHEATMMMMMTKLQ
jgi:hypothetical protein